MNSTIDQVIFFDTPDGIDGAVIPGVDLGGLEVKKVEKLEGGVTLFYVEDPFKDTAFGEGIVPEHIIIEKVNGEYRLINVYPGFPGYSIILSRFCDSALHNFGEVGDLVDPTVQCANHLGENRPNSFYAIRDPDIFGKLSLSIPLKVGVSGDLVFSPHVGNFMNKFGSGDGEIPEFTLRTLLLELRNPIYYVATDAKDIGPIEPRPFGLQGGMEERPLLITGSSGEKADSHTAQRPIDVTLGDHSLWDITQTCLLTILLLANSTRHILKKYFAKRAKGLPHAATLTPIFAS